MFVCVCVWEGIYRRKIGEEYIKIVFVIFEIIGEFSYDFFLCFLSFLWWRGIIFLKILKKKNFLSYDNFEKL